MVRWYLYTNIFLKYETVGTFCIHNYINVIIGAQQENSVYGDFVDVFNKIRFLTFSLVLLINIFI